MLFKLITSMHDQRLKTSAKHGLLLSVILLAFCFVYIYRLGDKALDLDERYSMNIATGAGGSTNDYAQFGRFINTPIPTRTFSSGQYKDRYRLQNVVSTAMSDNGQGLPYFFMLHGWLRIFGVTTFHARLLSALLMLIALSLLYGLMRRCGIHPKFALLAVALFGCNGVVIGLAQYVRFYSLGISLTVISSDVVLRMCRRRLAKWRAGLLGLLWGLMLLNQFFAIFIIMAQGIYMLRAYWNRNLLGIIFPITIGILLPVGLWLLPLHGWESLRNIYTLQSREHQAIYSLSSVATPLNMVLSSLGSFAAALGQPVNTSSGVFSSLIQILPALPAILLICMMIERHKAARPHWLLLSVYALAIYLTVSVLHSLLSGYTLLFQGRYWVFAYVFSYLLLARALMNALNDGRAIKWLAVCVLLATCGRAFYTSASAISGLALTRHAKLVPVYIQPNEDYEGMAHSLIKAARPGDTLSYQSWKLAQCVNWFLLAHPTLIQRVDTAQAFEVMICNGPIQTEVPFTRGRTTRARPLWLP